MIKLFCTRQECDWEIKLYYTSGGKYYKEVQVRAAETGAQGKRWSFFFGRLKDYLVFLNRTAKDPCPQCDIGMVDLDERTVVSE